MDPIFNTEFSSSRLILHLAPMTPYPNQSRDGHWGLPDDTIPYMGQASSLMAD